MGLFAKRRRPSTTPLTPAPVSWVVSSWSDELGRGALVELGGRTVTFDANACVVASLRIGERVTVEFDGATGRVTKVEPYPAVPSTPIGMAPEIILDETSLLDFRIDDPERRRDLENRLFDLHEIAMLEEEHGFVSLVDRWRGSEGDTRPAYAPTVRAFLEREVGRPLETLVKVSATYPFAWRSGDTEMLARIFQRLPGYVAHEDGGVSFFGTDRERPPYLDASVEPHGLCVDGVVRRAEWAAWSATFEGLVAGVFVYREL